MAGLDPNIILSAGRNAYSPLDDMSTMLDNRSKLDQRNELIQKSQQENQLRSATDEAYRRATKPDGTVDEGVLLSSLAQLGAGRAIPGIQKSGLELSEKRGNIRAKGVETDGKLQDILYKGLKETDNTIAGLLSKPDVTDRDVFGEMGRLVSIGAFNGQAQHQGTTPDAYARELLSTMPRGGDPAALRNWLMQAGARTMDATKRFEMAVPKFDEQDRGGVLNEGTINQMTGTRTAGANVTKTATPGEVLTDNRGRVANQIAREGVDVQREAAASQVFETPQGFQVVNKGTGVARPVMQEGGSPVLGKDSSAAKNASMARNMMPQIVYGEKLLGQGPTSSTIGSVFDKAIGVAGFSTKGGDIAQKLETLGGWMTSNVPRMEGPQGVQDVVLYQNMAGMIGDRSVPIDRRLAALETVKEMMRKYDGAPGTGPATMIAPRPAVPSRTPMGPPLRGYSGQTPIGARPGQQPSIDDFFK